MFIVTCGRSIYRRIIVGNALCGAQSLIRTALYRLYWAICYSIYRGSRQNVSPVAWLRCTPQYRWIWRSGNITVSISWWYIRQCKEARQLSISMYSQYAFSYWKYFLERYFKPSLGQLVNELFERSVWELLLVDANFRSRNFLLGLFWLFWGLVERSCGLDGIIYHLVRMNAS